MRRAIAGALLGSEITQPPSGFFKLLDAVRRVLAQNLPLNRLPEHTGSGRGFVLTLPDVRRCWMSPDSADHTPEEMAAAGFWYYPTGRPPVLQGRSGPAPGAAGSRMPTPADPIAVGG